MGAYPGRYDGKSKGCRADLLPPALAQVVALRNPGNDSKCHFNLVFEKRKK